MARASSPSEASKSSLPAALIAFRRRSSEQRGEVTSKKCTPGLRYGGRQLARARLVPMPSREEVFDALRVVEDPELGMDIVELGLLYDAEVQGPRVKVLYSLTSIGCPAGPLIQQNIEEVVRSLPGVEDVETELTWDPPWTPEKMSDDAKFILGFG